MNGFLIKNVYLEYIIIKHGTLTDKEPVKLHINTIQNRLTLKIKSG